MKKLTLVLVVFLTVFILIACKDDKPKDDRIVITYASWNLGSPESLETNMERLMINEFMVKYPNIRVDIIERPKVPGTTGDMAWNEFLAARASTQTLPDVFQSDNIPAYVINNWAYNMTSVAMADPEYLNISEDIRGVSTYNGKVMGIPNAVFYAGYIVNKDLYEYQGQNAPTINSTWSEFITLTKAATDHSSTTNQGVVGLEGIEHIIHWYPAQVNENYGWFTLGSNGFNLDSAAFAEAISTYRSLRTDPSFVWEALLEAAGQENSTIDISTVLLMGFWLDSNEDC